MCGAGDDAGSAWLGGDGMGSLGGTGRRRPLKRQARSARTWSRAVTPAGGSCTSTAQCFKSSIRCGLGALVRLRGGFDSLTSLDAAAGSIVSRVGEYLEMLVGHARTVADEAQCIVEAADRPRMQLKQKGHSHPRLKDLKLAGDPIDTPQPSLPARGAAASCSQEHDIDSEPATGNADAISLLSSALAPGMLR